MEVENRSAELQSQLKDVSAKLHELAADELQEQVSYWSTRVAVAEQSVAGANAKKDERAKEITRLDSRRVELVTRLHEAENSLNGLDHEKARLRENETALHGQIDEMRVLIEPAEKDLETAEQEEKRLQESEANAQRIFANTERSARTGATGANAQAGSAGKPASKNHRRFWLGDVRLRGGCFGSRAAAFGWHGRAVAGRDRTRA